MSKPSHFLCAASQSFSHPRRVHHCDVCGFEADRLSKLERHSRVHTGERPFPCPSCPRHFTQKSSLKTHLRIHSGERPHECHFCPQSFTVKGTLKQHLLIHTGERPIRCPLCPRAFRRRPHLKRHMLQHGRQSFQCYVCVLLCTGRGRVGLCHMSRLLAIVISLIFFVQHCGLSAFPQLRLPRNRFRDAATNADSCAYATDFISNLKQHYRVHTGERPFQCPLCTQSFTQKASLNTHLRIHTGERPHKCHFCPQSFSQKCSLKVHLSIHTGERPYPCPLCHQAFRLRHHLKIHMRQHE
nr:zinc finger protein 569-like [Rhipicephalus microplus]